MTPLLTPKQAAKELGIGVDTLSEMRKAGEIPYVNIGRGTKRETPRYELDDLIAWKESRKQRVHPLPPLPKKGHSRMGPSEIARLDKAISDIAQARQKLRERRAKDGRQ